MAVRAKFRVIHKGEGTVGSIIAKPVNSGDPLHENKKFWDATPSGELQMWISNPKAFAQFKTGKSYYFDISEAPDDLDIMKCTSCGNYHAAVKVFGDSEDQNDMTDEPPYFICPTTSDKVYVAENK